MQPSMGPYSICLAVLCAVLVTYTSAGKIMASNSPLSVIANASNSFSSDFFKRLVQEKSGNIICSPLSANIVLAMAAYGARGNTALQMRQTLRLSKEDATGQSGYDSLITTLNAVKNVDLRVANKIFIAKAFEVKPEYAAITKNTFHSECEKIDVSNSAAAAATINSWCANNTNNRIKDLISPDAINDLTRLVLVNAVYFKGDWKVKFDNKLTKDQPFHINSNTVKQVPTMTSTSVYLYGQLDNLDARFIELPYKGDELSMVIIMPNEIEGLQRIENNIHEVDFSRLPQLGRKQEVILHLPKFKIETTMELNDLLKKVGMTDMFTDAANFSGISDIPLKVSSVVQKAFIEVNEEGSEAAAATGILVSTTSLDTEPIQKPILRIDRPFYYEIIKRIDVCSSEPARLSLFSGVVRSIN
ncbi:alaserpin isoform X2 [Cephus cinctus]|uniref:Alaserpin isoform X2 n=1 Tax=Cephus cinctus TaxID=211228 RepID=A0AAJ7CEV1_CEPCN|nr:alaserpin isoform X2 [Cephus cinctus]